MHCFDHLRKKSRQSNGSHTTSAESRVKFLSCIDSSDGTAPDIAKPCLTVNFTSTTTGGETISGAGGTSTGYDDDDGYDDVLRCYNDPEAGYELLGEGTKTLTTLTTLTT